MDISSSQMNLESYTLGGLGLTAPGLTKLKLKFQISDFKCQIDIHL